MKLRAENVRHNFGATEALAPTTLEVEDGEFASIVGPSGCGKSTLFNIISGLLLPTAGRVFLDERDVTGQTGRVGYMLQKDLLLPWRTVTQNIVLGASLTGRVTRSRAATGSASSSTITRTRSQAACVSASRSCARSRCTRTSCCSTSRSARSTRRRGFACSSDCSTSGTTSSGRSSSSRTTSTRRSSSPTACT